MRIGIDLRFLGIDRRGMGRYVGALARGLLDHAAPAHEFVLLADSRSSAAVADLQARARPVSRLLTPAAFSRTPMEVCWFPWARADVRVNARAVVASLYDLAALRFPPRGWLRALDRWHDGRRVRHVVQCADVLAVPSAFVRDEILARLAGDARRVEVVPGGVEAASGAQGLKTLGPRSDGTEPFVLWVGSDEERKNLGTLLQAFARVRAGGWPGRLVLCGDNPNLLARHARTIRECALAGLVIVEGYVDEEALRRRYREAALFVFPSLYEGFGLPVLEAMASGTPVACARAASLPEIAGAAAEYFDPRDADDMARAMRRCLDDDEHAHRLAALGREQAAGFTWEAAADRMLGVFEQAAARPA